MASWKQRTNNLVDIGFEGILDLGKVCISYDVEMEIA